MSSATEYQTVPTTKKTTIWSENLRRCTGYPSIFTMVLLCVGFGVLLIIFGVLECMRVDNFSTKPSSCRVNSIGTVLKTGWRLSSSVFPVWNVDIVKQSQTIIGRNNLIVLHSNLLIRGTGDYRHPPLALEDAGQLYSVS
jgi:hypothetical protein